MAKHCEVKIQKDHIILSPLARDEKEGEKWAFLSPKAEMDGGEFAGGVRSEE